MCSLGIWTRQEHRDFAEAIASICAEGLICDLCVWQLSQVHDEGLVVIPVQGVGSLRSFAALDII